MIKLIKDYTGCYMTVGQNGRVWIKGSDLKNELIATEAILKINNSSYIPGLTEKMEEFLKEKAGSMKNVVKDEAEKKEVKKTVKKTVKIVNKEAE